MLGMHYLEMVNDGIVMYWPLAGM